MFPCQFRGSLYYTLSFFVSISHYFFVSVLLFCVGEGDTFFLFAGEGDVRISDQGKREGREERKEGTDKWTEGVEGSCLLGRCLS